jgi:hypothetical protein
MANDPTQPDQYAAPEAPTPEQLAALPHNNSGPKLNAVIWTLTLLAGLFLSLRMYCKFSRHTRLWWDDYILIASYVRRRLPFISERANNPNSCALLPSAL